MWSVCSSVLLPSVMLQSSLYDATHTLDCSTPALFYRRLRSDLIWKPVSYQFTFPSHSGYFLFVVSWCFHFHLPPCSQLKFPDAWARCCDLELLAPAKYTKFCSLDVVEYRELLAKCCRRRCVELSRHGPLLTLLGYTPLPKFLLVNKPGEKSVKGRWHLNDSTTEVVRYLCVIRFRFFRSALQFQSHIIKNK
jgi:hypothetical protein